MNFPNVRSLRTSHGVMQAKKTTEASTTPPIDFLPRCARRRQAHSPAAGRNNRSAVPFNAVMPQRNPNSNQGSQPSRSSKVRASQTMAASSSADKLVSQTQRVHQNITFGSNAQAHAEPTATLSEKMRLAIRKIGMQVRAEKRLLIASRTNADARE